MTQENDLTPEQYAYYIGVHHGRTAEKWRWSDDEIRYRAKKEFPFPPNAAARAATPGAAE